MLELTLRQHLLNGRDALFELLVTHLFKAAALGNLQLARNKQNQEPKEQSGLVPHDLVDCRATATTEGGVHLPDRIVVQLPARATASATAVARHPLLPSAVGPACDCGCCVAHGVDEDV